MMLGVIREIKNYLSYEANDKKNMAIENQTLIWSLVRSLKK